MKKQYTEPELKITMFMTENIVTASGLEKSLEDKGVTNTRTVTLAELFGQN